jgi:Cdc6-like AAA superfamily ATPase
MSSQKLYFLLAIVKGLKISNISEISFIEIMKRYYIICENLGLKPRSNSQLWNYLQEFKRENIVLINVISEKIKGRRALIQIPEINLPKLENVIIEVLNLKGINI